MAPDDFKSRDNSYSKKFRLCGTMKQVAPQRYRKSHQDNNLVEKRMNHSEIPQVPSGIGVNLSVDFGRVCPLEALFFRGIPCGPPREGHKNHLIELTFIFGFYFPHRGNGMLIIRWLTSQGGK